MDIWGAIEAERREQADQAATFTDEEWNAQTPCPAWTVRDVVAHLSQEPKFVDLLVRMVKARFNVDTLIAEGARETAAQHSNDELVELLRAHAANRWLAPGVKPPGQLLDQIVHGWDIRMGTGRPVRDRPAERYVAALDYGVGSTSAFKGAGRSKGLHLVATDVGWEWGTGPTVEGPAELVLAAIIGRTAAVDGLTGDGVEMLRSRGG